MSSASDKTGLTIERADILSATAGSLIAELNAELSRQYPEAGATHFRLDADEVAEGRGAFLVAWLGREPVGCGAVRRIDDVTGELKRMYVKPSERGRGIGGAMVSALERQARALGLTRLVLETGVRQKAAIALYQRFGFSVVPAFGEYVSSPLSVCMAKDLGLTAR